MDKREKFVARYGQDYINTLLFHHALGPQLSSVMADNYKARRKSQAEPASSLIRHGPCAKVRQQRHIGGDAAP